MQNNPASSYTLNVNGNIVNNGIIQSNSWYLYINVTGNISNNGTWANYHTKLTGTGDQQLSLGAGKVFNSLFESSDALGDFVAVTPLVFQKAFDLKESTLKLQSNSLTLEASGNIHNGRVINVADLTVRDGAVISNITYQGLINLKRVAQIGSGVTMEGAVTVNDTLQNHAASNYMLTVNGNIVNNGTIRNNNWYLYINVSGSVTNKGIWTNYQVELTGSGERTILGSGITSIIRATGSKVTLTSDNYIPTLSVISPSRCILENGTLRVEPGSITGVLENRGKITTRRRITNTTQDYSFFAATARIVTGSGLDSLTIFSHGHQVPQTFANAVKSWWSVSPVPATAKGIISTLTLNYTDAELGSSNESNI